MNFVRNRHGSSPTRVGDKGEDGEMEMEKYTNNAKRPLKRSLEAVWTSTATSSISTLLTKGRKKGHKALETFPIEEL